MPPVAWSSELRGAVIHVGAHFAEEASDYQRLTLPVLWIEGCPAFARRLGHALDAYENQEFRIAALSDRAGDVRTFHISNNAEGVSSSLKEFGRDAARLWPELGLRHVGAVPIVTKTLDQLMSEEAAWVAIYQPKALVLDVQGSELEVLQGAIGSLWRFDTIIIEVSSVNVYESGDTEGSVDSCLVSHGFIRKDYIAQVEGHGDALYVRNESSKHDTDFESQNYTEINVARWNHIDRSDLIHSGMSVLELGSGPGWFTQKLLDKGCLVTSVDGRPENIRATNDQLTVEQRRLWIGYTYDANKDVCPPGLKYDCVFAYGLLYHVSDPGCFLQLIREVQPAILILETCVTPDSLTQPDALNMVDEPSTVGSQSTTGLGCRPSRLFIWNKLAGLFPCVYSFAQTVPHNQFPVDWTLSSMEEYSDYTRMLYVSSLKPLVNRCLVPRLVLQHCSS